MTMNTIQLCVAVIVGLVTAVVSYRAIRDFSTFGGSSLLLSLCFGAMAGVGVMQLGDKLSVVTLPWAALGLTLCLLPIIRFLMGRRNMPFGGQGPCLPDKPVPPAGRSKNIPVSRYQIGSLLPPQEGE